jgi:tripartite ATP-independent transporter DctM subunit
MSPVIRDPAAMTAGASSEAAPPLAGVAALVLQGLRYALEALVVLCLVLIFADVLAGVISRYVFNRSFSWTEELGQWLFIYLIFLAVPLASLQGRHVSVGILINRLGERGQTALAFVIEVVVAHTIVMLMVSGAELMQLLGGRSPALNWPTWTKTIVIPAACAVALAALALGGLAGPRRRFLPVLAILVGAATWWLIHESGWVALPRTSPTLVMAIAFAVTMAIGVPVAFAMLFAALLANWGADMLPPPAVVQNIVTGSGKFLLLAIPLFLAAGHLMNAGPLTERLMAFAHALVGHLRGGLAQVNVMASFLFGGISGSSSADVSIGAKVLVPQMVKHGYSPAFSCAITAASGVLPNIVPPAIALLLFASVADVSVGQLFVAGIGAGLIIAASLMVAVSIMARVRGYGRHAVRAPVREVGRTFVRALPALTLAAFIIIGLRFGVVTATESGVIAVLWALLLGQFWYRSFGVGDLYRLLANAAVDAALVGLLIGVAAPFAWIMIAEQVPQRLIHDILGLVGGPTGLMLLLVVLLLLAGTVLDLTASLLIVVPLFLPMMVAAGVDPVHFGIIVVVSLMIGGITPPVGLLVFVACSITRTPTGPVFREVTPFFLALVVAMLMIAFIPAIPMTLVRWLY